MGNSIYPQSRRKAVTAAEIQLMGEMSPHKTGYSRVAACGGGQTAGPTNTANATGYPVVGAGACTYERTPNSLFRDTASCNTCGWYPWFYRPVRTEQSDCVPRIYNAQVSYPHYLDIGRTQYYTRADICDPAMVARCNCAAAGPDVAKI